MPFRVQCRCGQVLTVPDDAVGKPGQCMVCQRTFTIPAPGQGEVAPAEPLPAAQAVSAGSPAEAAGPATTPAAEAKPPTTPAPGEVLCWHCGALVPPGFHVCLKCRAPIQRLPGGAAWTPGAPAAAPAWAAAAPAWTPGPPVPSPPAPQTALGGLIPYKNVPALVGYYLAVFALLPCVGIALGIAAVVLGIVGLRRAALHPEARGKVHAWVAVILGGVCAVGYAVLLVLSVMGVLWA